MLIGLGIYALAIVAALFCFGRETGDRERMSGRFARIMEKEIEKSSQAFFNSMPAELKKEFGLS
ncbi:MAG: hypothetical protein IJU98_05535 [Synergistaceae bacterium]|nr:hypothetical protein [Synergistaceae bacterium]